MRFIIFLAILLSQSVHAKSIQDLVDEDWVEVKTPNFHIISDAGEKYAKAYAWDLEAFRAVVPILLQQEMGVRMVMKVGVPPLTVFAIEGKSNFKALGLDSGTAGIFFSHYDEGFAVASLRGYKLGSRGDNYARQTLLHEYVHFMMRNATVEYHYPVWYVEGLADFLATVIVDGALVQYGLQSKARLLSIGKGNLPPIEWIFKAKAYPRDRKAKSDFYAYSWMVIHYLSQNAVMLEKNTHYLNLWREGIGVDEAFSEAYGYSFAEFSRLIKIEYIRRKYQYKEMTLTPPFEAKMELPQPLQPLEVAYHLGRLQIYRSFLRGEDQDEMKESGYQLMEFALKHDPGNAAAQALIWGVDMKQGRNVEQLGKEISTFYEGNSKSPEVSVAYGDWLLQQADALIEAGDDEDAEKAITAARGKYRRAIYFDSTQLGAYMGMARIYRGYGSLFTTEKEHVEAISVNLELAYRLDHPFYRYNLALLYEQQGDVAEAREQYQRVARGWDTKLAEKATHQPAFNDFAAEYGGFI